MKNLELHLRDLGDHLDVPAGDGVTAAVVARIETPRRPSRVRWLAAAVLVAGGVAAAPAVADWLGTDEVEIVQGPAPTVPDASPLDLGRRVTLTEAATVAGFEPVLPTVLGEPDEVWVDDRPATPLVWLRWKGEDEVLMTQLVGHLTEQPLLQKYTEGATVEPLRIGRRPAFWIDGAHQVAIEDHDGAVVSLELRTADSTLLVDMVTFTVRIETGEGRDAAIRIAESLPGT